MSKYNDKLADKAMAMSLERLIQDLYTDHLTGAWNRRALDELGHTGPIAICDLDGLKWINDNLGHRQGDIALVQLANALEEFFPDAVYRLAGDEFIVTAESRLELLGGLLLAQNKVGCQKIMNAAYLVSGPARFSFGLGGDLTQADSQLREDKRMREYAGERSARGRAPPDIVINKRHRLKVSGVVPIT